MSTGRQRMSARDYKHAGKARPLFEFEQYKQFGAGLAVGLVLALFAWIHGHHAGQLSVDALAAETGPDTVAAAPVPASTADDAEDEEMDHVFLEMLPNFEVVVPDRNTIERSKPPAAAVVKPGAYLLQAGAFRNTSGAELQRDNLAKLGIEAGILHLFDDRAELHVVRVGPIRNLYQLNAIQKKLQDGGIDFVVQRLGD